MSSDTTPVPGLRTYRARLMDGQGKVETTIDVLAENDDAAIRQVRGLSMSYSVELWDGGRKVATVPQRKR